MAVLGAQACFGAGCFKNLHQLRAFLPGLKLQGAYFSEMLYSNTVKHFRLSVVPGRGLDSGERAMQLQDTAAALKKSEGAQEALLI